MRHVILQQLASEFGSRFGLTIFRYGEGYGQVLESFSGFEANPESSPSSNIFSAPVSSRTRNCANFSGGFPDEKHISNDRVHAGDTSLRGTTAR